MKVVFMGTPDFSVGTLEALVHLGHAPCGELKEKLCGAGSR